MLRNILAVLAGIILGNIVNMGLVLLGPHIIQPPAGMDVTTMEGLKASFHLLEPRHFIFPFLAHALGTFAGALLTVLLAVKHQMRFALSIGIVFLIGGIANIVMLPSPIWFTVLDLVGAYLPMGYAAAKIGATLKLKSL